MTKCNWYPRKWILKKRDISIKTGEIQIMPLVQLTVLHVSLFLSFDKYTMMMKDINLRTV